MGRSENRLGDLHMSKCEKIQNVFLISIMALTSPGLPPMNWWNLSHHLHFGRKGREYRWMSPLELLVFEKSNHHARLGKPISSKPSLFLCKDGVF